MKYTLYILQLCGSFTFPGLLRAQHLLSGKVVDARSGKPLSEVMINIPEIHTGVLSDSAGRFTIRDVPEGTYLVEAHLLGYATDLRNVSVKGTLQEDFSLTPSPVQLREVVVTGVVAPTDNQNNPVPVTVVDHNYLMAHSATNVIDAVTRVPGVSGMTDGQSITKPVIRGLGYNRVLTINDGVEQMDQPWFDEFGIEADPYAVSRYEILKGPASLAYGSDAIAGVLNLIPEAPLPEGTRKADVLVHYQSNSGLMAVAGHMAGTHRGISWSARIDQTMAHAYRNPADGYVLNS
ncbi:MAG: TonB-dependent receptor plug domain-containing protein, partial [Bacteroidota bacterium]|nr:TonB-dependent receptor plug domain-containing protein [Bacteroidota bacterium]